MRAKLLLIGHSYIFLIASLYVGLFTSLQLADTGPQGVRLAAINS